jgi:hypothetical protein
MDFHVANRRTQKDIHIYDGKMTSVENGMEQASGPNV